MLRDTVYTMVSHHVTEPEMRELLESLGEAHNRNNRNVLPVLYELCWTASVKPARRLTRNGARILTGSGGPV